ncbi:MAG: hypothetical protein QGH99_06865, partial [Pseudomonadales bacterium]|nr:hypothetical protein [Pseudomonadales bacterium]
LGLFPSDPGLSFQRGSGRRPGCSLSLLFLTLSLERPKILPLKGFALMNNCFSFNGYSLRSAISQNKKIFFSEVNPNVTSGYCL